LPLLSPSKTVSNQRSASRKINEVNNPKESHVKHASFLPFCSQRLADSCTLVALFPKPSNKQVG
jgi:hypothetical protein